MHQDTAEFMQEKNKLCFIPFMNKRKSKQLILKYTLLAMLAGFIPLALMKKEDNA